MKNLVLGTLLILFTISVFGNDYASFDGGWDPEKPEECEFVDCNGGLILIELDGSSSTDLYYTIFDKASQVLSYVSYSKRPDYSVEFDGPFPVSSSIPAGSTFTQVEKCVEGTTGYVCVGINGLAVGISKKEIDKKLVQPYLN
ncbi:MAG: hypothetical protein AB8E15_07050 [Bdellovibrionales bacterium]